MSPRLAFGKDALHIGAGLTLISALQVHYVWPNKQGQLLIGALDESPSYEDLLALLRRVPGSKSSQTWVERVINSTSLAKKDTVSAEALEGKSVRPGYLFVETACLLMAEK